jgi:hypothetical protein
MGMKYLITIIALGLIQLTFAQKEDSLMLAIDEVEIASIQSRDEIRGYFKDVSDLHLGIQNSYMRILNESGYDSAEFDSISNKKETVSEFLLVKMREYLSTHPYPTRSSGDTLHRMEGDEEFVLVIQDAVASRTLINIFINAPSTSVNLDLKKLYFETFYQSYKQGDINSGSLWKLLYGMYQQIKGEHYQNFEHGEEEQIEMMIEELGLSRKPMH